MKKLVNLPFKQRTKVESSAPKIQRRSQMISLENQKEKTPVLVNFKTKTSFLLILFVRGQITLRRIVTSRENLYIIAIFAIKMDTHKDFAGARKGIIIIFNL